MWRWRSFSKAGVTWAFSWGSSLPWSLSCPCRRKCLWCWEALGGRWQRLLVDHASSLHPCRGAWGRFVVLHRPLLGTASAGIRLGQKETAPSRAAAAHSGKCPNAWHQDLVVRPPDTGLSQPHFFCRRPEPHVAGQLFLADGIYAIPGVTLLFFLGYWFSGSMVSLLQNEVAQVQHIIILIAILGVAGYFLYRFLRRPAVTGDPKDIPPLPGQIAHTMKLGVGQLTSRIIRPKGIEMRRCGP